jgi:hypothetical protein
MQFADIIGQQIVILIPRLNQTKFHRVKLLGVESGGLWIQSQEVINVMLQIVGQTSAERTPVIFVPYHEIAVAMSSIEGLSLDEKAFGL